MGSFPHTTARARDVFFFAEEEARRLGCCQVGPELLLLGVVHEEDTAAARLFRGLGLSLASLRAELERHMPRGSVALSPGHEVTLTPQAKKAIEFAFEERRRLGHTSLGTDHLLLGLLGERDSFAERLLTPLGADLERVWAMLTDHRLEE